MSNTLSEVATRLAVLKALKEHKTREIELLNKEMDTLGAKLFELFGDAGLANVRIVGADIFTDKQDRIVTPDSSYKVSVVNPIAFFELLRAEGNGSLIKEQVHHTASEKWVKAKKEGNLPLPDESVLKVWTVESASVRRAPKRAQSGATSDE